MAQVKIECPCGQHYAFDVEPVNQRMPTPVACPTCGADGTAAANEQLGQQIIIPPKATLPRLAIKHETAIAPPPPAVHKDAESLGLVDRDKALVQARAKILWGDEPEEVIKYLMIQSFSVDEAQECVAELQRERLVTIRGNGMRKIFIGAGLICVTMIAWAIFVSIGVIPIKLMGIAIAVGLYGGWLAISGALMVIAPKMESGDVGDQ